MAVVGTVYCPSTVIDSDGFHFGLAIGLAADDGLGGQYDPSRWVVGLSFGLIPPELLSTIDPPLWGIGLLHMLFGDFHYFLNGNVNIF